MENKIDLVLKLVGIGTDKINFKILKMVEEGTNINKLIKCIGVTKMPLNARINKLEDVGLVKRWRGTGIVYLTELGLDFMLMIYNYQDIIRDKLIEDIKDKN